MAFETVRYERQDGVTRITLNRPDSLNALTKQLLDELFEALEMARGDPATRCLVLTGAGRGFCSGRDVGRGSDAEELSRTLGLEIEWYNRVIRSIREMEKPVVGGINGVAAGGGFGIALACDIRVGSDRARFVPAFGRVGLSADSGVGYHLPKAVGLPRATEILLKNRTLDAQEALSLGLLHEVAPAEEFETRLAAVAAEYAAVATRAAGLTKRVLNASYDLPLGAHLDLEAYVQSLSARTRDFREGLTAFQEKREAQFEGR